MIRNIPYTYLGISAVIWSTMIELSPHGSKGINFHNLTNHGALLRTLEDI